MYVTISLFNFSVNNLFPVLFHSNFHFFQSCAKTWVFQQKPSPVGLTGLNWVLMGFIGQFEEPNLENQMIMHKMDN